MNDEHEDKSYILRIGSLILHNIGQLLPHQLQSSVFHNRNFIYPVSLTNFSFKNNIFYLKNLGRLYYNKISLVIASTKSSLCIYMFNN